MRAFVLHGPKDMRLETIPDPKPGPDEVKIRIKRVGICGSDMHYYQHFQIGSFIPKEPFALGHEFSGEVVEHGSSVESVKLGDRVTVEPGLFCGKCRYCKAGRYNLCSAMRFYGSASCYPHLHGGFAEYVIAPARNCFHVPDGMSYGEGALIEPLAVGMHAVMRAGSLGGKVGLVTGGGTIGQTVVLSALAMGIDRIYVSDIAPFAREFSVAHGATGAVDPTAPSFADDIKAAAPDGFDAVFEASGSPRALAQSLELAGRGAVVVQIGTQPAEVTLPANVVMSKELTVCGSFRYAHVFPQIITLATQKRMEIAPMITQVFPFEEMQKAMDVSIAKDGVIKVQVEYT